MLLEVRLNLDVPSSVILPDGTTAAVKALAASVVDGRLEQIVYTVEKKSGAWFDVASEDVQRGHPDQSSSGEQRTGATGNL